MKKHFFSLLTLFCAFALGVWLLFDLDLAATRTFASETGVWHLETTENGDAVVEVAGCTVTLPSAVTHAAARAAEDEVHYCVALLPGFVTFFGTGYLHVLGTTAEKLEELMSTE